MSCRSRIRPVFWEIRFSDLRLYNLCRIDRCFEQHEVRFPNVLQYAIYSNHGHDQPGINVATMHASTFHTQPLHSSPPPTSPLPDCDYCIIISLRRVLNYLRGEYTQVATFHSVDRTPQCAPDWSLLAFVIWSIWMDLLIETIRI